MLLSHSVMSDSLWPHGLQQARPPCPSPSPGCFPEFMSIESVMLSNHRILCRPLLLLPSVFPCCSWGSRSKITGMVCHSLLPWATFCQNRPLWPVGLGWPCMAWLIASMSYASKTYFGPERWVWTSQHSIHYTSSSQCLVSPASVMLKLEHVSESPGGLIKIQLGGLHTEFLIQQL